MNTEEPVSTALDNILYPSDFSGNDAAFAHALRITLAAQSKLTLVHVATEDKEEWDQFPGVRDTLERWGLLPENSPRAAVLDLGIDVRKVLAHSPQPVYAVLKYLEKHHADLIVIATPENEGLAGWLQESEGEPVARESGAMTLFLPLGQEGFVSKKDGKVNLRKILIPIAATPDPQAAVEAAALLVQRLNCPEGTFTLLHAGKAETAPEVRGPAVAGWTWTEVAKEGEVIESIVGAVKGIGADLIVMATDGRDSIWDTFRGSHSERVLRTAVCPLLTVPVKKED